MVGFGGAPSQAADVATGAVGYVNVSLLRDSDTVVAVPLAGSIEHTGQISTITAGTGGRFVARLAISPGFTADQFKDFYYVRMLSGARRGMYFTIVGNSTDELTLDSAGYNFSTIISGDTICIRKYWTLGTLFPPSAADTAANPLTASTGTLGPQRRSQIIIPDNNYDGINLPAVGVYYFTADAWRQAVSGNPNANNIILHPDSSFIIRQPAVIGADTTWSVVGAVVEEDERIPLFTRAAGAQDNAVAVNRPFDLKLADTGLETAFVASASTGTADRRDQLLVFDNSVRMQNKTPSAVYYRVGSNWVKAVTGNPTSNNDTIAATAGIIVRKYQNPTGATVEWVNVKKP